MSTKVQTLLLSGAIWTASLSLVTGCQPNDVSPATGVDPNNEDGERADPAVILSESEVLRTDFLTGTNPESDPKLQGITALHNQARGAVIPKPGTAIPALAWNTTVVAAAQKVANTCVFKHSGNGYGENIYAAAGAIPTPANVVTSWTSESANYTYSSNTCAAGKVCGHYTQVVWRGSQQLGCAQKTCTTNSPFVGFPTWYFWVCDYNPAGNIIGQKPY